MEILTWRVVARGHLAAVQIRAHDDRQTSPPEERDRRPAYWPELGSYVETPVYDRYALRPGAMITGPAILEEHESTLLVPANASAEVDPYLNVIVRRQIAELFEQESTQSLKGVLA
jgi:N-methylhydantoinase A